jgi:hypothetical protein
VASLGSGSGSSGRLRAKNQSMAKDLVERGIYHGKRHHPTTQGINYPSLNDVGSAAYRRQLKRRSD